MSDRVQRMVLVDREDTRIEALKTRRAVTLVPIRCTPFAAVWKIALLFIER